MITTACIRFQHPRNYSQPLPQSIYRPLIQVNHPMAFAILMLYPSVPTMSHTDLAIRAQLQALDLQLFRISVTADADQKLPIKIPLKPMKTTAHALAKVKYLRFSRSKGYRIGLIPLEPAAFAILQTPIAPELPALLETFGIQVVYCNVISDAEQQCWLSTDAMHALQTQTDLQAALNIANIEWQIHTCEQGQGLLAWFQY